MRCSRNRSVLTVGAYRGNVALTGNYPGFVEKLQASGSPIVLVSLGNPYLLRSFPGVSAYLATFSPVPTSKPRRPEPWSEISRSPAGCRLQFLALRSTAMPFYCQSNKEIAWSRSPGWDMERSN